MFDDKDNIKIFGAIVFMLCWGTVVVYFAYNAMFGDLFEIRTKGFENRYLTNIKLCRTYKAAYEKTESEYNKTFSKRRYSSYDSFRQIRSRKMKKKEA